MDGLLFWEKRNFLRFNLEGVQRGYLSVGKGKVIPCCGSKDCLLCFMPLPHLFSVRHRVILGLPFLLVDSSVPLSAVEMACK